MSQRGSFCTEYIYCSSCLVAAREVLLATDKFLCSVEIPSWQPGNVLPIIAGKIGGTYSEEEHVTMQFELREALEPKLCHPLRIAVHCDGAQSYLYVFDPDGAHEAVQLREDES